MLELQESREDGKARKQTTSLATVDVSCVSWDQKEDWRSKALCASNPRKSALAEMPT